ncbi:MAG: alpha/beta fold hydrolase [Pyrinomonadaceae bacterium]
MARRFRVIVFDPRGIGQSDKPGEPLTIKTLADDLAALLAALDIERAHILGLLELSHEGTIFFDEIAEVEASIQAKLRHALEHKKFRRVGGVQEKQVNVRVIAATNKNLQGEIKRGRFREDLFYRLSVMPLMLPPLRERREDILPLVEHFITQFNQKLNRRAQGVTPKAEIWLESYDWPGNIRELRNVIERAIILCAGDRIHASELPFGGLEE